MTLPLKGMRIIAVEQYGAGPYGSLHLASLGAEIIKIETPGAGDVSRDVGPYFVDGEEQSSSSLFFQGLNHNKKSIALNLRSAEGKEILHALVKSCDGLLTNLRGDVVDRLEIGYQQLKTYNPKLVCAHLTAYGRNNDRADWPGYDYVMQAQAGYFSLTGEPDAPPARFGLSVVDLQSGVTAAMALLAGIIDARATGHGRDLDVSLYDVALHNLNYVAMWSLNAGHHQQRAPRSAHFSMVPCQLYRTQDGWIYVMCNKEKFWLNLCRLVDRWDLVSNEKFSSFSARLQNRDELTQILDAALNDRGTEEWIKIFGRDVPVAPLLSVDEALSNDFVKSTGRILNFETKSGASLRAVKPPVHINTGLTPQPAPSLGEDTDAMLTELGYSARHIAELKSQKIIQ